IVPNLPMMIETVIIPFKDKIIYDSLIQRHNVILGKNMRQSFNEKYIEINTEPIRQQDWSVYRQTLSSICHLFKPFPIAPNVPK
ncbi:MAG: hypothetical protein FWB99_12525, partial [Treponema sp.]|nr:hypothetical protein [Treponema sp.]